MHAIADTLVWLLDRQPGVQFSVIFFIFNAHEFIKPHYSIIH